MRRRLRQALVNDRLALMADIGREWNALLRLAGELRHNDTEKFVLVLEEIRRLREATIRALRDLRRYRAVPDDAPQVCRCSSIELSLPAFLVSQLVDVPIRQE